MAAALVGGALLNVVFDRLSSPDVLNWLKGKKVDQNLLGRLETSLYVVRAVLNDAEKKQITDSNVKMWLSNLQDAVYKADDLLDEVATKAATHQKDPGNFLSRFLNLQDREMADRMEEIIVTLESIVNQKDALGLKEIPKENFSWRITTSLVQTSDIYGRDEDKEAVTKLLLDDDTNYGEISVIPIVGMGGIGKTTLAQLVYNDEKVKQNFDFQAWVCVSEEFDVVKVTKTIIEAMTSSSCAMNDLNLLQHELKQRLSRRKFFVVLDDTWNENYNDWNMLLKPFRDGVKGSKILMTTRSSKVASLVQTVRPHELRQLSNEDCWLVFAKHALVSANFEENSTLKKIGRAIVNKCDGLPLAAQTLGGLLRGNHDASYWNRILKSEIWNFSEDRSKILPAFRISYYYLPSPLKECFLYCSLYPKDYQFKKHELTLLWMAENFVQSMGEKTLEDVGHEYFDELVSRSFFQLHYTYYNSSVFVIHDLIHDLATYYAGEFYFRDEDHGNAQKIDIKTRHLSHNANGNYPISRLLDACDRVKHSRTFLELNLDGLIPFNMENAPCILLSQLKCLRVVSFKYFPLDTLPESIGELIHLRYLDLSFTHIVILPESLSNLYNLQTLKLRECYELTMLPISMQDLVNLRHLDISGTTLKVMPKGMSKLKHLQLLSDFILDKQEENEIKELGGLVNLRDSLCISELHNVMNSDHASEARMADKRYLDILCLKWSSSGDTADSQIERDILCKLRPHIDLKKLKISGYRGTSFPNWLGNSSYHNMTEVSLGRCKNCCMLPSLGQLPSLKSLKISKFDALEIVDVEFYKNGDDGCLETPFPSLEFLSFESMPSWKKWNSLELDIFPRLKELRIWECPVLTGEFPNQLPTLETLIIYKCKQLSSFLPRTHAIKKLRSCSSAISFPVGCLLASLKSLSIYDSDSLTSFSLDAFPNITELHIERCKNMKSVEVSQSISSLRNVSIYDCPSLVSFSKLTGMFAPQLEYIRIWCCPKLDLFPNGDLPPNLKELHINKGEKLMSFLSSMNSHSCSLETLFISGECNRMTSFPEEGLLPASLETLYLQHFPNLEMLECKGLVHLTSLKYLTIEYCPKLENIVGERLPTSLIELIIVESPLLGKRCEMKDPQVWPKISHIHGKQVGNTWIW